MRKRGDFGANRLRDVPPRAAAGIMLKTLTARGNDVRAGNGEYGSVIFIAGNIPMVSKPAADYYVRWVSSWCRASAALFMLLVSLVILLPNVMVARRSRAVEVVWNTCYCCLLRRRNPQNFGRLIYFLFSVACRIFPPAATTVARRFIPLINKGCLETNPPHKKTVSDGIRTP